MKKQFFSMLCAAVTAAASMPPAAASAGWDKINAARSDSLICRQYVTKADTGKYDLRHPLPQDNALVWRLHDPADDPPVTTEATTTVPKLPADENGIFIRSDFENGSGGWTSRKALGMNDTTVPVNDSRNYAEGASSLRATNRSESWHGLSLSLEPYAIEPGTALCIQAAVMQNSTAREPIKMELHYFDTENANEQFVKIQDAECQKGTWKLLRSNAFQIPENASEMKLYFCTAESCGDFWIDSVTIAKAGTAAIPDLSGAVTDGKLFQAMPGGTGFKDVFGPYFRVGASINSYQLDNEAMRDFYLEHFNSVTCENEMCPDAIIKKVDGTKVTVDLKAADPILRFAEENSIGVRGRTFVWYSQTPDAMFTGTQEEAEKRIEDFMKETFIQLKTQYPALDLYAYDVCNEMFKGIGGGFRVQQSNEQQDTSRWAKSYGENGTAFAVSAFKSARKYAPRNTKLFLNDFNEFIPEKCNDIVTLAKDIMHEGDYIDGIGLQAHLDTAYPDKATYESALKQIAALGLDIQLTELDIMNLTGTNKSAEHDLWKDIFSLAMTYADQITSVTLWNPVSPNRNSKISYLFTHDLQPNVISQDLFDLTKEIAPPAKPESPAVTTIHPEQPNLLRLGDTNCDTVIDVSDAVLLLRFCSGDTEAKITDQGVLNGDADQNGITDDADADVILQHITHQINL